jgi:hypothetical protein
MLQISFLLLLVCGLAMTAQANLITNGNFEAFTGKFDQQNFRVDTSSSHSKWLDRQRWESVYYSAWSNVAEHIWQSGGNTDLLMQGFPLAGTGVGNGSTLELCFDYIWEDGIPNAEVIVQGFGADGFWDFAAPWPTNGAVLFSQDLDEIATGSAQFYSNTFTVGGDYAAIAVGFFFGYGSGEIDPGYRQAIDNVCLEKVAEPASLILLGFGILGIAGLRRKK